MVAWLGLSRLCTIIGLRCGDQLCRTGNCEHEPILCLHNTRVHNITARRRKDLWSLPHATTFRFRRVLDPAHARCVVVWLMDRIRVLCCALEQSSGVAL